MASQHDNAPEVYQEAGLEPVKAGLQTYAAHAQHLYPTHMQDFESKYDTYPPPQPPLRCPFGLTPLAFGSLVALVTMIIVGATVGGGLGGTLATCRAQQTRSTCISQPSPSSTADPTPSSTGAQLISNYSVPAIATIDSIYTNCPDAETQPRTTYWKEIYTVDCYIDYTQSLPANGGGEIGDIAGIIAYSLDDCIAACSYSNQQQLKDATRCKAVTWRNDLKNVTADFGANCWLKNATLADRADGTSNVNCVSAYLR